ncbi:hypothetical protein BCR44DRAFT_38517 [Catenaria anguillulae PL171]|uniref:Uncharacterized protein n=1 Tax=Catenaria anguillulae PL171 TaxID=765915 RepID=A0A1Y2HU18_9FUNG|nr:hypothetical protein BCR44DRAFT_38517 [Catenaria anguillulae PL171]
MGKRWELAVMKCTENMRSNEEQNQLRADIVHFHVTVSPGTASNTRPMSHYHERDLSELFAMEQNRGKTSGCIIASARLGRRADLRIRCRVPAGVDGEHYVACGPRARVAGLESAEANHR